MRNKTVLKANGEQYVGVDGYTMKREYGMIDADHQLAGEWVLRDSRNLYVDHDGNRHDLAERNHITLS